MLSLLFSQFRDRKALLLLGFLAFAISTVAYANNRPQLSPIPTQTIFPQQAFVYRVTATDSDGSVPALRMINGPSSATFEDNRDGSRTLRWRPPADVPTETVIILQAVDANDSGLISTQRLVLRRGDAGQSNGSNNGSNSGSNTAPQLPEIGTQNLTVNQDYQLFVRPADAEGTAAGLTAAPLPNGASLDDAFDGSRVLRWRPSADQVGEHKILFVARDGNDASLTSQREIVFRVSGAAQSEGQNNNAENNVNVNQPYFEPISAPVVSAGQRVKFTVIPRMPDKSVAILHVDRLPPGATFADNYNGTRTFDWETNASDQGEHVFRFTAIHHQNPNQRVTTEVLIVIGDPAAPGSNPENNSGDNSGAPKIVPIGQQRVVVGNDLRFRVFAFDDDGSLPGLYIENPPANSRFEDNRDGSREFYWTPSQDQSGPHQLTFVANDHANSSLSTRTVITINVLSTDGSAVASGPPPIINGSTARPNNVAEAARFLQRATFGPDAEGINSLMRQTYVDWINDQMHNGQTSYRDIVDSGLRQNGLFDVIDGRRQFDRQQVRSDAFWKLAVDAPDQLRQRVAFALSQILVISDKDAGLDSSVRGTAHYHDLLASEAFGNYRTLLSKVTLNPMMGDFLSMRRNEKPDLANNIQSDENYAREMMQLFTLGLVKLNSDGTHVIGSNGQEVQTYSQDDVVNLARVFTGWNYGDSYEMRSSRRTVQSEIIPMKAYQDFHDPDPKTIVGNVKIPGGMQASAELEMALDAIFNHPNVPPFVSKQLIQRLVTSNPSPDYVRRVSNVFANNGKGERGDLSAVIPAILLDEEALNGHQQNSWAFGKLKEPVIKIASIWRAFDARGKYGKLRYSGIDADFAQSPYSAPSVFNFYSASYKPPGAIGNENKVAPEAQILNDYTILKGADRLFDYAHAVPLGSADNSNQHAILLNINAEKSMANDVPALVEHLSKKLLAGSISDNLRATLIELGNATPNNDGGEQRVRELLYIIFISPEFSVQR